MKGFTRKTRIFSFALSGNPAFVVRMAKAGRTYVNQSISFPPHLLQKARDRAERLGLRFSPYVQKCIEFDLLRGGSIEFTERDRDSEPSLAAEKAGNYESSSSSRRKTRKKA